MRKIFAFLIFLSACSGNNKNEKTETAVPPVEVSAEEEWITYEGIIQTEDVEYPVELALLQGETGLTSTFMLKGDLNPDGFGWVRGEYSILSGADNNEIIIQTHGKIYSFPQSKEELKKVKNQESFKPDVRDLDLYFKSDGPQKLILVDSDFEPIAKDARYTLYKRSRLFTAEGYITFEETRTDFHEQNTQEDWSVAPLGLYHAVQKTYDSLATEKFEGVYLKALAYSVESDSTEKELLVIKRVLEIKKSRAYADKKKAAQLGH